MGNVSLDISIDRIKEMTQNAIEYKKIEIERVSKRVLFDIRDKILEKAKEGESHVYMESYGYCDIEMIKNEFEAKGFKVTSEGSNAAGCFTKLRISW
jgi:hypothetical protein